MIGSFYSRIAISNLAKNRRFFVPRILTEAGLVGSSYIIGTLARDERLGQVKGGAYLPTFMGMGMAIILILSVILMLYTNSFLMKQRKREFGLYNVLGMEKRHVGRVLFAESLICALSSVVLGLFFGALFYKLCSLAICRLLRVDVILGFYFLKLSDLLMTAGEFLGLDLLIYFWNRISIARMKPVEMLRSAKTGEKEPKVRILIFLVGVVALAAGYGISITTKAPLRAIGNFFEAVLLVILGTYCLFTAGSIFVLKVLKKNEAYYYSKKHMAAVSGMLYRMKQNAVGLASITILATCVMVMISTTVSLYAGVEDVLANNYPQHQYISASWGEGPEKHPVPNEEIAGWIREIAEAQHLTIADMTEQEYLQVDFAYMEDRVFCETDSQLAASYLDNVGEFIFVTADAYREMTGETLELGEGEIAVNPMNAESENMGSELTIGETTYRIRERLLHFPVSAAINAVRYGFGIVVPDETAMDQVYRFQKEAYGKNASKPISRLAVTYADVNAACDAAEAIRGGLSERLQAYFEQQEGFTGASGSSSDCIWDTKEYVYGMFGSLFFLGILLGAVFLFATALIIYYKQISEGYEDRERFQIMEKIGMSREEVKSSIRSQILMVFFLPLMVAGIHVAFAFPLLLRMLRVLLLSSVWLFVGCTVLVFGLFALVYVMIYLWTARTYYKIVH